MLNIKDIRERNHVEPPEVTEIRENITNAFQNLEFQEGPHKYYLHKSDGSVMELPSVSHMTHIFKPEFDKEEKAQRYALKHGYNVDEVLRKWEETTILATNNGTLTHLFGEDYMKFFMGDVDHFSPVIQPQYEKGYLIPYSPKQQAVAKFYEDLFVNDSIYPVMPEAQVYMGHNKDYDDVKPYAGTFDMLFTYKAKDNKWKLLLYDWKGLPLDTPILTTQGFKTMGELSVDDIVYDKDGQPTKILHKSEVHHNPCMKIHFQDDDYTIVADCDHRWLITFAAPTETTCVMTTKELQEYMKGDKEKGLPMIEINKPIQTQHTNINMSPFILGFWFGFSDVKKNFIKTKNKSILKALSNYGYCLKKKFLSNKGRYIVGLDSILEKYNLNHEYKEIPQEFILNWSMQEKRSFIRGFIFGISNDDNILTKTQSNKVNHVSMLTFVASMGYKPEFKKVSDNESRIYYIEPKNEKLYHTIIDVTDCETVPTQCIEVDSPSHTYLADYYLLVTHNTNKELIKESAHQYGNMALPPFDDLYDENLTYYKLQLSAYALCLQQLGYEVADRKVIWLKDDATYEKISLPDYTKEIREALQK